MGKPGNFTNRYFGWAVVSLLITSVTACAQLPEYAKPRTIQLDAIPGFRPTGFTYRQLQPKDFQATALPKDFSGPEEKINAHAVVQIRLKADAMITVKRWPFLEHTSYFGSIDHIAFEAVLIPEKSWWNPKIKVEIIGYVLQHEQIHFALTELAARKLTSDAKAWGSNLLVIRQTPQEVYAEITRQIKELISSALEINQKRHEAFDKDTSLFFSPAWQAWWLETVEEELNSTLHKNQGGKLF